MLVFELAELASVTDRSREETIEVGTGVSFDLTDRLMAECGTKAPGVL